MWDDFDDDNEEFTQLVNNFENTINFNFPLVPYEIQLSFARELYHTLDRSYIGIFESPTGTGKSLSLICGALTWLIKNEQEKPQKLVFLNQAYMKLQKSDNWLSNYGEQNSIKLEIEKLEEEIKEIEILENRINESMLIRRDLQTKTNFDKNDKVSLSQMLYKMRIDKLLDVKMEESHLVKKAHKTKIFFCSRTHSQLLQFLNEIKKTIFYSTHHLKIAILGSRKRYCINEDINNISAIDNPLLLNDRCLSLLKKKTKTQNGFENGEFSSDEDTPLKPQKPKTKKGNKSSGCQFYHKLHIDILQDYILSQAQDIEDIVTEARTVEKACPYYASRLAANDAQLVLLPYNLIISQKARKANDIDLSGNILIIDEAHNLLENITSVHSNEIRGIHLFRLYYQIQTYMERYGTRVAPSTITHLKDMTQIIQNLINFLQEQDIKEDSSNILTVSNFLFKSQIDNYNLYKINQFCDEYQLGQKLSGIVYTDTKSLAAISSKQNAKCNNNLNSPKEFDEKAFLLKFNHQNYMSNNNNNNNAKRKLEQYLESSSNSSIINNGHISNASQINYSNINSIDIGNPMINFKNFLGSLNSYYDDVAKLDSTQANQNAKIMVNLNENVLESKIKYVLLNPSARFMDILSEARSVILAGGTMQPIEDFKKNLFYPAKIVPERITIFQCGHIIPANNIKTLVFDKGTSGQDFNFTFQNRTNLQCILELGAMFLDVCDRVRGGVIVFFPSYQYEAYVYQILSSNSPSDLTNIDKKKVGWSGIRNTKSDSIIGQICRAKKLFREARTNLSNDQKSQEMCENGPSTVEKDCLLRLYGEEIKKNGGAIMFSVINGSLSEGINFNDDLARCVIVVGLPYPNLKDPELIERLKYYDSSNANKNASNSKHSGINSIGNNNQLKLPDGTLVHNEHYQNMCMKAVNQSIGRAIRHKADYAVILLCDKRYLNIGIRSKLPSWIKESVVTSASYQQNLTELEKFFQITRT